ncbi:MAG: choice-of-anchor M domain-containing protein, partial [Planctomycetota bacterium]
AKITTIGPVSFLGTTTGQDIWVLPQDATGPGGAETLGLPFVGIATEELSPSTFSSVDITLTNFSGPGEFALWQNPTLTLPATVFMQTVDGVSSADNLNFGIGIHGHHNYGFTAEGVYQLEWTATGNFSAGGTVTDVETFTFVVGSSTAVPEPSGVVALASFGLLGLGLRRRRRA